jgi:hypothetical protein
VIEWNILEGRLIMKKMNRTLIALGVVTLLLALSSIASAAKPSVPPGQSIVFSKGITTITTVDVMTTIGWENVIDEVTNELLFTIEVTTITTTTTKTMHRGAPNSNGLFLGTQTDITVQKVYGETPF